MHFTEGEWLINYTQYSMVNVRTVSLNLPAVRLSVALPIAAFFIPLFIPSPQIVVGSLVNALLVLYALKLPSKSYTFVCLLPSVGALGNGLLFGISTPFLMYLLPGIWAGNLLFLWGICRMRGYAMGIRIGIGATIKSLIIFFATYVLVKLHVVPSALLIPMGAIQIVTAVIGGTAAAMIHTRI